MDFEVKHYKSRTLQAKKVFSQSANIKAAGSLYLKYSQKDRWYVIQFHEEHSCPLMKYL